MDLELIIPERMGGHYSFDDTCRRDMGEILWYKTAGFSLSEIQRIFIIKRFTGVKSRSDIEYMRNLFIVKKEELLTERVKLDSVLLELEEKINETGVSQREIRKLGVPLSFLGYLVCPRCKSPLFLKRGEIEDNMVMEGEFGCSCGFSSEVQSGVLVLSSVLKEKPALDEYDKWDYIERTAPEFMNFMYKGYEWITKKSCSKQSWRKDNPGTRYRVWKLHQLF
jgi:DNA-binding transcriptional MerR regulator